MQMAARETGFGAVEQYMHAGKLLALELTVRVLENPHHHWSALRPEVCGLSLFCDVVIRFQRWASFANMSSKIRNQQLPGFLTYDPCQAIPFRIDCCAGTPASGRHCVGPCKSDAVTLPSKMHIFMMSSARGVPRCRNHLASHLLLPVQFCEQLRQPLCLALLRNCTSVFDEAYSAATRLFTAILLQPKLRWALQGAKISCPGNEKHLARIPFCA